MAEFINRWLLAILLLMACTGNAMTQIQFTGSFDGARLDSSYLAPNGRYTLAPAISVNCLVTGLLDSTPEFQIFDSEGYRLRNNHRMVYRYVGDSTWHFFDHGDKTGSVAYYHFSNDSAFTGDSIVLAYWFPWNYIDQVNYVSQINGSSPYLKDLRVAGLSQQGRNIYAYEITDTNWTECGKMNVVWTGRQHSTEFKQSYVTNGFTEYLLYASDPLTDTLRRYFRFHIYPMMNPDGVFNGGGTQNNSDPNRNWIPGGVPGACAETNVVMADLLSRVAGQVEVSIDIHSNPGHRNLWYWWGQKTGPNSAHIARSAMVTDAIAARDSADHGGNTVFEDSICCNSYGGTSLTASNWFHNEFGTHSFTLEPSSAPGEPITRLKSAGASIARALTTIIDRPGPMSAALIPVNPSCAGDSSGQLGLVLEGGAHPLSYLWSNGDTTAGITMATAGTYSVTVTDDSSCTISLETSLTDPPLLMLSSSIQHAPCAGDSSGAIILFPSGGQGSYNFTWSGGQSGSAPDSLAQGWYHVTVLDSMGCSIEDSFLILEPPALNLQTGTAGGTAWVQVTGGVPPWTYLWSDAGGTTSDTVVVNSSGTYTVWVTDSNGCGAMDSIHVSLLARSTMENGPVKVFPNPNQGIFQVIAPAGSQVEIWSASGKLVGARREVLANEALHIQLEKNGFYWLRVLKEGYPVKVVPLVVN